MVSALAHLLYQVRFQTAFSHRLMISASMVRHAASPDSSERYAAASAPIAPHAASTLKNERKVSALVFFLHNKVTT